MYAYKKPAQPMPSARQEPEEEAPVRKHAALRGGFERIISPFRRHSSQAKSGAGSDAHERYRKAENLIATGSIGSVYHYDDEYVMKDYSGIVDPDRKGRLRSAMNNAAAFNRLYGAGSANVMMRKTDNPLQKAVSVKLRRISGASLTDILALSVLWLLCSIPVLTLGAATTALYDSVVRCIRYKMPRPYERFFRTFKNELVPGALLTLLTKSMLFGGLLALEWGAYLLLDFFYSYTIAKEKGWKFLPVEIILYPAFHFAYGFGSLCGIAALPKFVRAEKEKKKAGDGR